MFSKAESLGLVKAGARLRTTGPLEAKTFLSQPCIALESPTGSPVSLAVECTLGQACGILVDLRTLLGLISAASSELLPACPGTETVPPSQVSPTTATLWGWGSWLVYAGSCCTTSEQLKIAASIAMATGAASLSYEGQPGCSSCHGGYQGKGEGLVRWALLLSFVARRWYAQ